MRVGALLVLASIALGCTSGGPVASAPVTCQSTVIALCKAACACGATDASQLCAVGDDNAEGGVGRVTWATLAACETYYSAACGDGAAARGFTYQACNTDLSIAPCLASVDDGRALALPAACDVGPVDGGVDAGK